MDILLAGAAGVAALGVAHLIACWLNGRTRRHSSTQAVADAAVTATVDITAGTVPALPGAHAADDAAATPTPGEDLGRCPLLEIATRSEFGGRRWSTRPDAMMPPAGAGPG